MYFIIFFYVIMTMRCATACHHIVRLPAQRTCSQVATGVHRPQVTYIQERADGLRYAIGTIAIINCAHLSDSLLIEGSTANAPAHSCALMITCLAPGHWSNSAVFSCKKGCYPLNTTTPEHTKIAYTGTRSGLLYASPSTARVNCQPLATRGVVRDLFAGTAPTTVISGTADEMLWCDQDGRWKNTAWIAQTTYNCNNNYETTAFTGFTGMNAHGEFWQAPILNRLAATTHACGGMTSVQIAAGAVTQVITNNPHTHLFQCFDGIWQTQLNDGAHTQQGDVVQVKCFQYTCDPTTNWLIPFPGCHLTTHPANIQECQDDCKLENDCLSIDWEPASNMCHTQSEDHTTSTEFMHIGEPCGTGLLASNRTYSAPCSTISS